MELEKLREELSKFKTSLITEKTGIPYQNLRLIIKGETKRPKYDDVVKLLDFLEDVKG